MIPFLTSLYIDESFESLLDLCHPHRLSWQLLSKYAIHSTSMFFLFFLLVSCPLWRLHLKWCISILLQNTFSLNGIYLYLWSFLLLIPSLFYISVYSQIIASNIYTPLYSLLNKYKSIYSRITADIDSEQAQMILGILPFTLFYIVDNTLNSFKCLLPFKLQLSQVYSISLFLYILVYLVLYIISIITFGLHSKRFDFFPLHFIDYL